MYDLNTVGTSTGDDTVLASVWRDGVTSTTMGCHLDIGSHLGTPSLFMFIVYSCFLYFSGTKEGTDEDTHTDPSVPHTFMIVATNKMTFVIVASQIQYPHSRMGLTLHCKHARTVHLLFTNLLLQVHPIPFKRLGKKVNYPLTMIRS